MDTKKLLFTINPNAGKSEIKMKLLDIINIFTENGYDVTVHPTQKRMELPELIPAAAPQYDLLVTCGGDGTFNETLNGLMHSACPLLIGYIPSGTVNDFASSLGIPKDAEQAARVVMEGTPFACDVGQFNDRYFAYIAAFGAFTNVAYQTPQNSKNLLGRTAYVLEGIKRLPQLRPYHIFVSFDGGSFSGEYLFGMITNATSVGGFKLNGRISMSDGLMEVVLIKNPHNLIEAHKTMNAVLMQQYDSEWIDAFHTSTLTIRTDEEVPWTLDGEFGGSPREAEIHNCRQALNILVAPEAIAEQNHTHRS